MTTPAPQIEYPNADLSEYDFTSNATSVTIAGPSAAPVSYVDQFTLRYGKNRNDASWKRFVKEKAEAQAELWTLLADFHTKASRDTTSTADTAESRTAFLTLMRAAGTLIADFSNDEATEKGLEPHQTLMAIEDFVKIIATHMYAHTWDRGQLDSRLKSVDINNVQASTWDAAKSAVLLAKCMMNAHKGLGQAQRARTDFSIDVSDLPPPIRDHLEAERAEAERLAREKLVKAYEESAQKTLTRMRDSGDQSGSSQTQETDEERESREIYEANLLIAQTEEKEHDAERVENLDNSDDSDSVNFSDSGSDDF